MSRSLIKDISEIKEIKCKKSLIVLIKLEHILNEDFINNKLLILNLFIYYYVIENILKFIKNYYVALNLIHNA